MNRNHCYAPFFYSLIFSSAAVHIRFGLYSEAFKSVICADTVCIAIREWDKLLRLYDGLERGSVTPLTGPFVCFVSQLFPRISIRSMLNERIIVVCVRCAAYGCLLARVTVYVWCMCECVVCLCECVSVSHSVCVTRAKPWHGCYGYPISF